MFHHATITTTTQLLRIATRWSAGHVLQDVVTTARASHIAQHHTTTISVLLQSLMATTASQVQVSQETVLHLADSLY